MAGDAQNPDAADQLEALKGGLPLYALPENEGTLNRLRAATGLKVELVNAPRSNGGLASHAFKFTIPEGVDRDDFVDAFLTARRHAGLSKDTMPILDSLDAVKGSSRVDPSAFYVLNDGSFREDALTKVEAAAKTFVDILPRSTASEHNHRSSPAKHAEPTIDPENTHKASFPHAQGARKYADAHRGNIAALKAVTVSAFDTQLSQQAAQLDTGKAKPQPQASSLTRRATNPSFS